MPCWSLWGLNSDCSTFLYGEVWCACLRWLASLLASCSITAVTPFNPPSPSGLLRRAWQDCLHAWKPLTGYMAWFAALNLALLTPMTAWLLEWIVRGSGDVAISNHDLAGFALSLRGALFLIVTIALYLAVLQVEVGGLTLLAAQAADRALHDQPAPAQG